MFLLYSNTSLQWIEAGHFHFIIQAYVVAVFWKTCRSLCLSVSALFLLNQKRPKLDPYPLRAFPGMSLSHPKDLVSIWLASTIMRPWPTRLYQSSCSNMVRAVTSGSIGTDGRSLCCDCLFLFWPLSYQAVNHFKRKLLFWTVDYRMGEVPVSVSLPLTDKTLTGTDPPRQITMSKMIWQAGSSDPNCPSATLSLCSCVSLPLHHSILDLSESCTL